LHGPSANPHLNYSRLSRYDALGLLWLLQGRRVIALTADTAAIVTASGTVLNYRKPVGTGSQSYELTKPMGGWGFGEFDNPLS